LAAEASAMKMLFKDPEVEYVAGRYRQTER
jgi:hypothetical protein